MYNAFHHHRTRSVSLLIEFNDGGSGSVSVSEGTRNLWVADIFETIYRDPFPYLSHGNFLRSNAIQPTQRAALV